MLQREIRLRSILFSIFSRHQSHVNTCSLQVSQLGVNSSMKTVAGNVGIIAYNQYFHYIFLLCSPHLSRASVL